MTRPVYSLDLSPRENRHHGPRHGMFVWNAVGRGVLGLILIYIVLVLVMGGF
jgi:hypothetical protein